MSLNTTVYIDADESLDVKTDRLRCILDTADIEVEVEVDFDYSTGHAGSWEEPPEPASADYTDIYIGDILFHAGDESVEENIKILMTKEQKEAITYLATLIIERDWHSKYEEKAFSSLPDPYDDD